jgi:hypothetical protein
MSYRITIKDLEGLVDTLNRVTGQSMEPWSKNEQGKFTANIGNYHLAGAYGGYELHQMVNNGGGVTVIINGYQSKKDLFYQLRALLDGIRIGKEGGG